jgi:Arc/MetJ-type ribon-helix-helix transcriptional regulator
MAAALRRIGRPPAGSTLIGVRLPPNELAALDAWIAKQNEPRPSRPEAIRHHLKRALASETDTSKPRRTMKPK